MVGITLAVLRPLAYFAIIPLLRQINIALDAFVIWALATRGRDIGR